MKEKNKKILKGLGVGALACIGMVGLTGCANIEVSQDKVDSMIETVEKADSRLDEYIDLLERQNQQLQDQNEMLEEQNKLLEEVNRMTKEEVWNFAKTADFNLMTNANGLRDNVVSTMEATEGGNTESMQMLCYNSNEMKVFAELYDGAELWYQVSGSNVLLANIDRIEDGYVCNDTVEDKGNNVDFDDCFGIYRGSIVGLNLFDLTYEKFSHYEILENSNLILTYIDYSYNYQDKEKTSYEKFLRTYKCEYSLNGKLVSLEMRLNLVETEGDITSHDDFDCGKITLNYGAVDAELVESWVELAEAKRNEQ